MRYRRSVRPALRAVLADRLRSALALACVAAGVTAVVFASAVGEGAKAEVLRSLEAMGADLLVVRPAPVRKHVARPQVRGVATSLVREDGEAIAELARVERAVPARSASLRVRADGGSMSATVIGTTPDYPAVRRYALAAGQCFAAHDDREARRVAVLGARIAAGLFAGEDPTGRTILVGGQPFEVCGVFQAKGAADGADEDRQVVIPLRTALRRVFNSAWLDTVFVAVRDPEESGRAETDVAELLRERHRRSDDFAVQDRTKALSARRETAAFLGRLTAGLGAATLLGGGTGILALMLLAVKERTREIGLRMALGATPGDVFLQFLTEASLLAFGGWLAGAALGGLGAAVLARATGWSVAVPVAALAASLVMAAAIGLGFGSLPARRASFVPPIRALA
jgi:putative ABC transport system permease protein